MGDILTKKSTSSATTTQNRQIGVSSGGSASVSAIGDISSAGGTINVVSSDIRALEANQDIANTAILASQQLGIESLHALQTIGDRQGQIAEGAVAAAQYTALNATPQNPQEFVKGTVETLSAQTRQFLLVGGAIIGIGIVGYYITKRKT